LVDAVIEVVIKVHPALEEWTIKGFDYPFKTKGTIVFSG